MDGLEEQQLLKNSSADDFLVTESLGVGKHGLVVKAKRKGSSNPHKFYAVKLLFNFTHEYTSVVSNKFENEWIILSRLLPHPNIARYWSQFISPISQSFLPHIPSDMKHMVIKKKPSSTSAASTTGSSAAADANSDGGGEITYRRGQFLVFDCYSGTLSQWFSENRSHPNRCSPSVLLKLCHDLLSAVYFLENHNICHLDLKLDNLLVSCTDHDIFSLVLCDFGCAIQFQDNSLELQWLHGVQIGGNRAHLSPEVLTEHMMCRADPSSHKTIHYKKQEAFAAGVLIHEIITGEHPLEDYPISYTQSDGRISFPAAAALDLKIPSEFRVIKLHQTIQSLITSDPSERMSVSTALNEIDCLLREDTVNSVPGETPPDDLEQKIRSLEKDKTFAQELIQNIASERDQALKEMKVMVEQCQEIAMEFDSLAKEHDSIKRRLTEVRKEKEAVEKASENAFQAYNMVKKQLELITRERDMARHQVNGLKQLCSRIKQDGEISECIRCKMFLLSIENHDKACCWHKGKYRWSCCYKNDEDSEGCMRTEHLIL